MKVMELREEQHTQLEILKFVDDVCKKEGLHYYLAFGTLLGAVREHGFISWDDDIDIWMKKTDFEKLASCIGKYLPQQYFFQTTSTDKHFFIPCIGRICVNGTVKWKSQFDRAKFHRGLYFDIFVLEDAHIDESRDISVQKICANVNKIIMHKYTSLKEVRTVQGGIAWLASRLLPVKVSNKIYNHVIKNKDPDKSRYICYASPYPFEKNIYQSDWFITETRLKFEGFEFECPSDYDALLKKIYGHDYMTPKKTKPAYFKAYFTKGV